jgi:hypothetical protein
VAGRSTRSLGVMNRPVEQWWTDQQLALVEDRSRWWHLKTFEPSAASEHFIEGVRVLGKTSGSAAASNVIEGGWDHEHCELCWTTISPFPGDSPTGYTDGDRWLCAPCYTQYIQPREKA